MLETLLVCALGAGIGSLIALEIYPAMWWVGIITGGLVGYVTIDPKQVRSNFHKALEENRMDISEIKKSSKLYLEIIKSIAVDGLASILSFLLAIFALLFLLTTYTLASLSVLGPALYILVTHNIISADLAVLAVIIKAISWGLALPLIKEDENIQKQVRNYFHMEGEKFRSGVEKEAFFAIYVLKNLNPISLWLIHVPRQIGIWAKKSVTLPKIFWEITKRTFVLIHSQKRLLCATDAAIGACVGYMLGSSILGSTVGGILGVVNFELVSKRLLRIKLQ